MVELKIKHLYWRAGFGLSPTEWSQVSGKTLSSLTNRLFAEAERMSKKEIGLEDSEDTFFRHKRDLREMEMDERKGMVREIRGQIFDLKNNWMGRMAAQNESPLLERMCLFWHGHFACQTDRPLLAQQQLNTLRKHGLGNFRELVIAISKDGSMIDFLNGDKNRKARPNENFARELLELFTIGIGNYTENDIREAARAYTGWNYDENGRFAFRKNHHDDGIKTFMGKQGNFDGDDIVNIILENKKTADFIATKVYKYFVNQEYVNNQHIREISDVFYNSNYNIREMMYHIFTSPWFFEEQNMGTKIKSPIDLLVGMMKSFEVNFGRNKGNLVYLQKLLAQELFFPPGVKGWDGGRAWINNSSLLLRLKLLGYLLNENDLNPGVKEQPERITLEKSINRFRTASVEFQEMKRVFGSSNNVTEDVVNFMLNTGGKVRKNMISTLSGDKSATIEKIAKAIASTPEYQLC